MSVSKENKDKDQLQKLFYNAQHGESYPMRLQAREQIAKHICQNSVSGLVKSQIEEIEAIKTKCMQDYKEPESLQISFEEFCNLLIRRNPDLCRIQQAMLFTEAENLGKLEKEYKKIAKDLHANIQEWVDAKTLYMAFQKNIKARKNQIRRNHKKYLYRTFEQKIDQLVEAGESSVLWDHPRWIKQDLATLIDLAKKFPGQAIPVFLENSVFRDHVVYLEYKKQRKKVPQYAMKFHGNFQLEILQAFPDWSQYEKDMLTNMLSDFDLQQHFFDKNLRFFIEEYLFDVGKEKKDKLFAHIKENYTTSKKGESEWHEEQEPQIFLFGEVGTKKDQRTQDTLLSVGAIGCEEDVEVPTYRSWAKIHPIGKQKVENKKACIEYSPHFVVPNAKVQKWTHTLEIQKSNDEIKKALQKSFQKRFEVFSKHDLLLCKNPEGKEYFVHKKDILDSNVLLLIEEFLVSDQKKLCLTNDPFLNFEFGEYVFSKPTDAQIQSEYFVCQDGLLLQNVNKLNWTKGLQAIEENMALWKEKVSVTLESTSVAQINWAYFVFHLPLKAGKNDETAFAHSAFDALMAALPLSSKLVESLVKNTITADWINYNVEYVDQKMPIEQKGPFSERGILRAWGDTPQAIIKFLQEHGMGSLCPEIPSGWIGEENQKGRLKPTSIDYSTGGHALVLHPEAKILHGMTGTRGASSALNRLRSIIDNNGLKSIAERRRMGIRGHSMSPLGDIASGVDVGVPCKIGTKVTYGDILWFSIKPEALQRRDIWFSDQDFGPGHSRYEEYNQYAEKLGHRRFYEQPRHHARKAHLQEAHTLSHNEVWFKHEVPLQHIEAIYVDPDSGLLEPVKNLVKKYRDQGIAAHMEVLPYQKNQAKPFAEVELDTSEHLELAAFQKLDVFWKQEYNVETLLSNMGIYGLLLDKINLRVKKHLAYKDILWQDIIQCQTQAEAGNLQKS